jgi:D-arabinose 1-dehydrogenase-like Zn-dependent alcohol dehydrogenase
MIRTGRAAVYERRGEPMRIREFPLPEPRTGSILVRLSAANICGSDLHTWHEAEAGLMPNLRLPVIWGHEMAGRVAALGEGVERDSAGAELHVGDRIVYKDMRPCFHCRACARGKFTACPTLWSHRVPDAASPPYFGGAFAEYYYLVSTFAVYRAPDELSDVLMAGVNCALSQVIYGLEQARFRYGDTLAIQGAGGLGIYMSALAKQMGAARVIVIDGVRQRLEVARAFGADETIDLSDVTTAEERIALVRELTDGWGADVVAEVSGAAAAWPEGIAMVGRGGVYLTMGAIVSGQECSLEPPNVIRPSKRVIGVAHFDRDTLRKALQFLVTTRETYPYHLLTGDQYPLDAINDAFADADARRTTRAAIVMNRQ